MMVVASWGELERRTRRVLSALNYKTRTGRDDEQKGLKSFWWAWLSLLSLGLFSWIAPRGCTHCSSSSIILDDGAPKSVMTA